MLASAADAAFDSPDYSFEVKWDGIRCLCLVEHGRSSLYSRHGREITDRFPELSGTARAFSVSKGLFDGELCVFNAGKPDFQAVQRRNALHKPGAVARAAAETPAVFVVFDVLRLGAADTIRLRWIERRQRLQDAWRGGPGVVISDAVPLRGRALFEATRKLGLEGIVAKHHGGPYVPGRRTRHWLKIRHRREADFVIGGYTPQGRIGLASLAVGVYAQPEGLGGLIYVGRVGTGFSQATRGELLALLRPLHTDDSPFRRPVPGAVPVAPKLVCRVEYLELTAAGRLRHATFRGLRPDVPPERCTWPVEQT